MKIPSILKDNLVHLEGLCEQFKMDKLYIFGSALTRNFDIKNSDLDFIAILEPMEPIEKGKNLLLFWESLEKLFGRKVDLLSDQPIKNPILSKNVHNNKYLIYDRTSKKVSV